MKRFSYVFILSLVFGTNWAWARDVKLSFDYPVQVAVPTSTGLQERKDYQASDTISLDNSRSYWIQSPGRVPMLFVPVSHAIDETIKLELPAVAEWPPERTDREMDRVLASMLDLMNRFQVAMTQRKVEEAERLVNQMTAVRDLPSLDFFRAYVAFAKGDLQKAKSTLKKGLERNPANETGLQLLKTLEGGR